MELKLIKRRSSKKVIEEEKLFSRNPEENIYLLDINEKGAVEIDADQFLRVPNYSRLILRLFNGSPISKNCFLITNYGTDLDSYQNIFPVKKGDDISHLNKHQYNENNTLICFTIDLTDSGGYFFQICFEEENGEINITPEIWIVIDPFYKLKNQSLDLSSISMQTILSKSLGKLDTWEQFYQEASSLNYNFIHYTPVQPTGGSESLYCLYDQTDLNDCFFEEKLDKKKKFEIFEENLMKLEMDYNLLGIVDIVLNHTSTNSQWLYDNPDSAYNLVNSPHLTSAFILDDQIRSYSIRYGNKKVSCPSAPYIYNDNDLNALINELGDEIRKLRLEEFFLINVEETIERIKVVYNELKGINNEEMKEKRMLVEDRYKQSNRSVFDLIFDNCSNYGAAKYGVVMDCEIVGLLIFKAEFTEKQYINEFLSHVNKINEFWKNKSLGFIKEAIENVRKTIHYEFIQNKVYKVTDHKHIVENYFFPWMGQKHDKSRIFANNGWLFGSNDPTVNFAHYGQWDYLKRTIVIWGDCVKLRYGEKPSDSPFLWEHMSNYVESMARIFNGFRLDNAHSTPINVAQFLINKARKINPHLLIIAELFAGSKEKEIDFVKRIGINLLIREMIWCWNANEISSKLYRYGGGVDRVLGKIDERSQLQKLNTSTNIVEIIQYKKLVGQQPRSIIFDITHDNVTYYDKTGSLALNLPMIATVGVSLSAIGTTRGFDQLFFYQPSVVRESRLYKYERFKEEEDNNDGENGILNGSPLNVYFEYTPPWQAKSVKIAISALNWATNIYLDKFNNNFSKKLKIPKGVHYYKYIIDDHSWVCDNTKEKVKDKNGHENNVVRVGIDEHPHLKTYSDLKVIRNEINLIRKITADRNNEYFLHQENDCFAIFRLFHDLEVTDNFNGYALIARPVFDKNIKAGGYFKVELPGIISELVFAASILIPNFEYNVIRNNKDFLLGAEGHIDVSRDIQYLHKSAKVTRVNNKDIIEFTNFLPNSVFLLKIKHNEVTTNSLLKIRESIENLQSLFYNDQITLSVADINHILYKCEKEELFNTNGKRGVYDVPVFGKVTYAGISHINLILNKTKVTQELGHSLYNNIRTGDWLFSYFLARIKEAPSASEIYQVLTVVLKYYSNLPNYLKPHYSSKIIDTLYNLIRFDVLKSANPVLAKTKFTQDLLMSVFQFIGNFPQCQVRSNISMAAGLPHFATEYMRCWGRDTFISLKGLLLIPGYYNEARQIILEFASCLRHGLIPNLLDKGIRPRYNARDAAWFFLQSVQDYIKMSPEGVDFLNQEVDMVFLDDDMNIHLKKKQSNMKKTMKISEIVHSIFQAHAQGINYREWNAGKSIDEHMTDQGFNVKTIFDEETGFIVGGNQYNCGTWMDKMGSSEKAKNKGIPATPRDGANVELIGLVYSNLKYFIHLQSENQYPYVEFELWNGKKLSYVEWMNKIHDNFEKHFWIGFKEEVYSTDKFINKKLILNEEIYKDIDMCSNPKSEYQLRPNFLIAMAVAPELFSPDHAIKALTSVEKYLIVNDGLGVRTLSPNDRFYNGNYINNNDSNDYFLAHGFNYHNGPEWVWLYGYYIRAKITFNPNNEELKRNLCKLFIPHMKYLTNDAWQGLPELTNTNNSICPGSCNTQAWSIATILEGFYELYNSS